MTQHRIFPWLVCFLLLIATLTSCALPVAPTTSTPKIATPTIAAFQQTSTPTLIESDPSNGSVLGLQESIKFYFNQPMDQAATESSLAGLPEGKLSWQDDATLVFTPSKPYVPDTKIAITITDGAKSSSGIKFINPVQLIFSVTEYLRPANFLPKADASDVDTEAAIAVSFNQPVVALGSDASSQPPAFSIQPSVKGRGEWINTSTYIYYPTSAMAGGTKYTVSVNPDLKSVSGSDLDRSAKNLWTFTTSTPRVVSIDPLNDKPISIDTKIKLTFNQPMDADSVQQNFLLSSASGSVDGTFSWNDDKTELTFTPSALLERNAAYTLSVTKAARSQSGTTLEADYTAAINTVGNFAVISTDPAEGQLAQTFSSGPTFFFNAPLPKGNYDSAVTVTPPVDHLQTDLSDDGLSLVVTGDFQPDTTYEVMITSELKDRWDQKLGAAFKLTFKKAPPPASLNLQLYGTVTAFVRPDEPVLYGNAVNVRDVNVFISPIGVQDFLSLQGSYEKQQAYVPSNIKTLSQTLDIKSGRNEPIKLALTQNNTALTPGLYYVNPTSPQINSQSKSIVFAVSSNVNLAFKLGATEALIWAVNLNTQTPVANKPIVIYDMAGNQLASGQTDDKGLWKGPLSFAITPGSSAYAVLGNPGDDFFALAASDWGFGVNAWDFGYSQSVFPPHTQIYLYTDRPVYRSGQTVYFRGAARQAFNGRYELPSIKTLPLTLTDPNGTQFSTFNLQLSSYGTFNGQFVLPEDAPPGYYTFSNPSVDFYFAFQVAEYRKPEINLSVSFNPDQIKLGQGAKATVNARYFFDAPASGIDVKWALYARDDYFYIPNYETGLVNTNWLDAYRVPTGSSYFGKTIKEGTGQTTRDGLLIFGLPQIPESDSAQILTLEVTAQDESGLPVSARMTMRVHPADFYIGLHPDQWFGTANQELGFDVFTSDWNQKASANHTLSAEFKQVTWEKQTTSDNLPKYVPAYTSISSSNLATGPDGKARLSFIPPQAGTYILDVSGEGARSQTLIWVGGSEVVAWPDLPNQRLQLTADQESYKPGESAQIFIPNPFATKSLALITVERGLVLRSDVIELSGSGSTYKIDLTEDDAPNVYVSATVLGQGNDFRAGILNLKVAPDAQELNVEVSNPQKAGPGDNVTFDLKVTDNKGQPVQGEFSLSVVDLAALALANPNAEDILPAYYSVQSLGVQTGLSLAAYGGRSLFLPGGLGGGGGEAPIVLREKFPDTAYWNPSVVTDADGKSEVTMTLPDTLTTWHVDVRGLTTDTKVGQADTQLITTKPLIVRPVTPRFLVLGDHILLAAIINNTTDKNSSVVASLQADGFTLDEPDKASQDIDVPANGRARVEWWGTVTASDSGKANLVFSAQDKNNPTMQDASKPVYGDLPIMQYTSPQTFVTGGVLRGAATQEEVISLPRTYSPNGGGLDVELSPSLGGSLLSSLDAMEVPDFASGSTESILSYFLPNLELYRALQASGRDDPTLTQRIKDNLDISVRRLVNLQNKDGGWSWWSSPLSGSEQVSDSYISVYALFGLERAKLAGVVIDETVMQKARTYVSSTKPSTNSALQAWELDRLAFVEFTLQQSGNAEQSVIDVLFNARDQLSPWAKAYLALMLNQINPADTRAHDIVSNLESSAIRSAEGADWQSADATQHNPNTTLYTTAIVVYALSQLDPANDVTYDAVRFLAAHRNTGNLWGAPYENAWIILALTEAMKGFGELQADFSFSATLNDNPLANGSVKGPNLAPITSHTPLESLSKDFPNRLNISRVDGLGRLYYHAALKVNRPVETVPQLNQGMQVDRIYFDADCMTDCSPLATLNLSTDKRIKAQLTLTLPHDSYYVMLQDFIPAGTEILNRALKTSEQANETTTVQAQYDDKDPFAEGWGWWLFHEPQIRDESIQWSADYLPAGTYVLTYTLVPLQAGQFRVLPAHAWESFFPDVQGTSAGSVFELKP